ncbi:putative hydroxyacylglutathione hydrolase [Astathelohania contejeani]|uniref:hydroxyacylglutathione hydrolase n=1 Tax=Astathelohania contejeani TaxID=164912 RepID=A0ABQ7HWG3_9MICR|nr:putative hydroxyacylglutathione hydrolase [Thelohania contejeani]
MDYIAIVVREDNFMYLFYNETVAFSIDSYRADLIIKALSLEFEKNIYTESELRKLKKRNLPRKLLFSLTTHHHFDHSNGDKDLLKQFPSLINYNYNFLKKQNSKEKIPFITYPQFTISYLHTPCHTQDSVCFYVKSNQSYLLTGDTIFYLGVGKFFEGTAEEMLNNIIKISDLESETLILYGHDYHKINTAFARQFIELPKLLPTPFLTLEDEKNYNPFFNYKRLNLGSNHIERIHKLRNMKDLFKYEMDL